MNVFDTLFYHSTSLELKLMSLHDSSFQSLFHSLLCSNSSQEAREMARHPFHAGQL